MKGWAVAVLLMILIASGIAWAQGGEERFVEVANTFLDHPAHPILVVFPLGLFPTALLFDIIHLWSRNMFWRRAAYWVMLIGFIGGLGAGLLRFLDYFQTLPKSGGVYAAANRHWQWIVAAMAVFFLNILVRLFDRRERAAAPVISTLLSIAGVALVLVGGFWGGHLVFDDRVGVTAPRSEGEHHHGSHAE